MIKMTCPHCEHEFEDEPVDGSAECPRCGEYFNLESEPNESMDGDAQSALASAGMGTDEDYEHNLIDDNHFDE